MTSELVPSAIDPEVSAALALVEKLNPLKSALGIERLTDSEMQLFALVSKHTGLDPFTKQIYAIKRGNRVTHQTGIDGYRSSAERTGQYAGSEEAEFEACDCGEAGSPTEHPKVARVVVNRILANGHVVKQLGKARWHELKPDHVKPQGAYDFLDAMWWRMPHNQLAKCAEADGLRKAFPRVLGGVYITEEMQQAETVEGTATVLPTARERLAARRAEREAPEAPEPIETPQDEPVEGFFTEDEAPPLLLSKPQFMARLKENEISADHAASVRLALFPDPSHELEDADRGVLWLQLAAEKEAREAVPA